MILRSGKVPKVQENPKDNISKDRHQKPAMVKDAGAVKAGGKPATPAKDPPDKASFAIKQLKLFTAPKDPGESIVKAPSAPPPFIVPYQRDADAPKEPPKPVQGLTTSLNAKIPKGNYIIRNLNNATQIRVNDTENYMLVKNLLQNENIEFYSYQHQSAKLKKFVLYGLNNENTTDIHADLVQYGLKPVEIKTMRIANKRYSEHNNFVVYFDYEDRINIDTLKDVKYICNTVVRWAYYNSRPSNIIQCRNCFKFNHNATECHMLANCMICAKQHKVEDCPLMKEKLAKQAGAIPEHLLQCCNCKQNHTAIYQNCPARINFVNKQQTATSGGAARARNTSTQQPYIPAPVPTTNAWNKTPQQPPTQQVGWDPQQRHNRQVPTTPKPTNRAAETPAATATIRFPQNLMGPRSDEQNSNTRNTVTTADEPPDNNHLQSTKHNNRGQYKQIRNSEIQTNNDSFSIQEVSEIFQEMLEIMGKCRNKQEQLNALMTLALKHLPCLG